MSWRRSSYSCNVSVDNEKGLAVEPRISIITLGVTDLARSVEFYRDGLGLPLLDEKHRIHRLFPESRHLVSPALRGDTGVGGQGLLGVQRLFRCHPGPQRPHAGGGGRFAGRSRSRRRHLVKAAQDTFWGGYSGYFADPESYLWEIAWNPHFRIE